MPSAIEVQNQLKEVFSERQATVLTSVIISSYDELVKTRDFNELKEIVREIAKEQRELTQAQKRTEIKVGELVEAQKRTEEAQRRTEEAQRKTEIAIQKLTKELKETRGEVGGLSKSVGYAFENEAYRMLPSVLKEKYGIELQEKLIRVNLGGKEINILGKARREGNDILILGEAKLRLDERRKKVDIFKELEKKVKIVKEEYQQEVVKILITHFARKGFIKQASEQGVIVIQSFEW